MNAIIGIRIQKVRGFTLIEVLVVIAIIAIVAAIAYPVFSLAKHSALDSKTVSNLRQLQMATMIYQQDQGNSQSSGTPEEMGLPPYDGFIAPYPGTKNYLQPWLADMKSPFADPGDNDYGTFAWPSSIDQLPVTWAECTAVIGEKCVLYWDPSEPGRDPVSHWWKATEPYDLKLLRGITLEGNLITREDIGSPYSQAWWYPSVNFFPRTKP